MSGSSSKSFNRNPGDWECPDKSCGNINFARRDNCNLCDTAKPNSGDSKKYNAIGQAAAKNSRGLFSAEDWSCMKCGNINWARRSTCNICNAKKFADEERTGYGGGYNERGNVEYKDRESSDSEYDEFGRRKKKSMQKSGDKKSLSTKGSREARRSRSRSSRSTSTSSSDRNHRRKRSRRSRSRSRSRGRRRGRSSSSSSSSSPRDRSKRKEQNSRDKKSASNSTREPEKEKSPDESNEDEDEESGDEDLSKYNLFDDDFDIEALKKDK